MKKFFAIAVIATAFVACNNSAENKETPADTTATETIAPADTTTMAPADTTTMAPAADTTTKM